MFFYFISLVVVFLTIGYLYISKNAYTINKGKRVCIVVLGDLGHSPRMNYHALSLTKHGFDVDFIGYKGSKPMDSILNNKKANLIHLSEAYKLQPGLPRLCFLLYAPFKVLWLLLNLIYLLMTVPAPSHYLLQNPPAIPTIVCALLCGWLRNSKIVIDWHNFGYTILAMKVGQKSPFVVFHEWYEKFFGRMAHDGFCVTNSMKSILADWGIEARTLYDKPPLIFDSISLEKQHDLFTRLNAKHDHIFKGSTPDSTLFTNPTSLNFDKALLISSTSWTADEDFFILLNALKIYDSCCQENNSLPDIECVITGKGPLRDAFEIEYKKSSLKHVRIHMLWLDIEDYPLLLASSHIGISLHLSSSGYDLPMKVVDMLGSGLPVCAVSYKSIDELVKHGENGLIFKDHIELASQLEDLLKDFKNPFSNEESPLTKLRRGAKDFQKVRWDETWDTVALPVFQQ